MVLIFLTNVAGVVEKCCYDRSQDDAKEFDESMKTNPGGGPGKRGGKSSSKMALLDKGDGQ